MALFGIAVQAPLPPGPSTPMSMLKTDDKEIFSGKSSSQTPILGSTLTWGGWGRAIQHMEDEQHHLALLWPADYLSRYVRPSMVEFLISSKIKSGETSSEKLRMVHALHGKP